MKAQICYSKSRVPKVFTSQATLLLSEVLMGCIKTIIFGVNWSKSRFIDCSQVARWPLFWRSKFSKRIFFNVRQQNQVKIFCDVSFFNYFQLQDKTKQNHFFAAIKFFKTSRGPQKFLVREEFWAPQNWAFKKVSLTWSYEVSVLVKMHGFTIAFL